MPAASPSARDSLAPSQLAERAFARATGAVAVAGNDVRLLLDSRDNYPAWLSAIASARESVRFETYIIADDATGAIFVDALCERARAGVQVFALFDWLGSHGASRLFERLRACGVHVRVFNPPKLADPLGWITRNHRKTITVDGRIASSAAFVSATSGRAIPRGRCSRGAIPASRSAVPPWPTSRARSTTCGGPAPVRMR
jgi:phosphatidylserine/phosphatidylglycerophosphate/cardiolipin synthase-like enzyme